ncbi:MAG: hypothetical protein R3C11_19435 [Planctomycetaceae bacterium]
MGFEQLALSKYDEICDRINEFVDSYHDAGWKRRVKKGLDKFILRGCSPLVNRLCGSSDPDSFGILMYHRVVPQTDTDINPTWNVTPERMEEQLSGLIEMGFKPIPLSEMIQKHQLGLTVPEHSFVVI